MESTVKAYILMEIEMGKTDDVINALREIDEAITIAVTTGGVDIVVLLEVQSLEDLYKITVQKIHRIPGIRETDTAVVEKMISV